MDAILHQNGRRAGERNVTMSFRIIGTGSFVPNQIVTNDDLAKTLDTSDAWIRQRVGIRERRVSTEETAADMGYQAALSALADSGVDPGELDLIIAASLTGETLCPTTAGTIQKRLGATCPAFDINSACSGFLFALDTAAGFFARHKAKKALVIGSERMSKLLDWQDRSTCVIFGDGAGAAVLEVGSGYLASKLFTAGGDEVIKIPTGVNNSPYYKGETETARVFMDGQATFKFAVNAIVGDIEAITDETGIPLDSVKYIVPHQANTRIIQYAAKRLGISSDRFYVNIERFGNTSAASIPIALDELNRAGKLAAGDIIILTAFGGGLSSASCIIKW